MTLTPISSSMFSHIGYDADTLTLFVQFNPSKKQIAAEVAGDLWAYAAVIPERWAEMQAAESVGKYFLANIKGKYTGEMVVPLEDMIAAGRQPDSIEIVSTPVDGHSSVMPEDAKIKSVDCGIGGDGEEW